jgi:hypothetical protein
MKNRQPKAGGSLKAAGSKPGSGATLTAQEGKVVGKRQRPQEIILLSSYAETLFRKAFAIDGTPTKKQVSELKAEFDNVQLWMDAVQELVQE